MKCSKIDCDNHATVTPVLHLFSRGNNNPAEAEMNLPMCRPCSKNTRVDDLLTDEAFKNISMNFIRRRRAAPIQELTKVVFETLKE